MHRWFICILLLVLQIPVFAESMPLKALIDQISFQMSARQWVSTQTALLSVEVNATLGGGDIVKMRKDIMDKLSVIAKGDWHITRFDRSQDTSGLEKLYVQAEARVGQDKLTNIYIDAKKISKPGINYTVLSVDFKPDLEDMQQARQALRQQLYQKVNEEITRINATYGEQHYTVNRLVFSEGINAPEPLRAAKMMNLAAAEAAPPSAPALTVSNELILTVFVEAASNRVKGS